MKPTVSIGMPIYNGEKFVRESIDSILSQKFKDFELIISDNCSTDDSDKICREYASLDSRVRFYKNQANMGASWNYNRVFHLATGKYFKWAADDDLCHEDFLSECVDALEKDERAVIAFSYTPHIDLDGNVIGKEKFGQNIGSNLPVHIRFQNLVCHEFGDDCRPVFGLIRKKILEETGLIGNFIASDQVILAELILRGHFIEIPKSLQFRRIHSRGTGRSYRGRHRERYEWFVGKTNKKFIFPQWKIFGEFIKAIYNAPLKTKDRLLCYKELVRWLYWGRAKMLYSDLKFNTQMLMKRYIR
jgi:glycosyltransferase involved in cell wall biosynthesis